MNKFKVIGLILLGSVCMGMTDCEAPKGDLNQYVNAAGKIIKIGKDGVVKVEEAPSTLEKAIAALNVARDTAAAANAIPGAQAIATPLTLGFGALATLMTAFAAKKTKEVKVEKADKEKAEAKADNYSEAIEAGIMDGDNQSVVNVSIIKEVMDKSTKEHFNSKGLTKI